MRVVEVWLDDDFKNYFYTREPMIKGYPIGNITKQQQFRKDNCPYSFSWFMQNVAYEVYDKFPPLPPNVGWGEVSHCVWCLFLSTRSHAGCIMIFCYTRYVSHDSSLGHFLMR